MPSGLQCQRNAQIHYLYIHQKVDSEVQTDAQDFRVQRPLKVEVPWVHFQWKPSEQDSVLEIPLAQN